VELPGGCQKLVQCGSSGGLVSVFRLLDTFSMGEGKGGRNSHIPAPGHTTSTPPNSRAATSNMRSSCAHSVTSVSTNTAFGDAVYCSSSFFASGRSPKSAISTLQPFDSSSAAKEKLMPSPELHISDVGEELRMHDISWFRTDIPEPAPVTIADFPSTEKGAAILIGVNSTNTTASLDPAPAGLLRNDYMYVCEAAYELHVSSMCMGMCCTELVLSTLQSPAYPSLLTVLRRDG
jgi:hypothetical protein